VSAELRLRRWGAACGIAGPIALTIYFASPALTGWPFAGAPPDQLIRYAGSHQVLFYAGAWLQATGAFLSVLFFLALLQLSGKRDSFFGLIAIVSAFLLLAVVLAEAAFLVAVPAGAAAGDAATVATTFALSNGVFVRVFPLAPAPALFGATAAVLVNGAVIRRPFAWAALAIAVLFELAGIAAIFSTTGLIFAIVMSIVQEIWIIAAAIALLTSRQLGSGTAARLPS
jgi:hypothetical protein